MQVDNESLTIRKHPADVLLVIIHRIVLKKQNFFDFFETPWSSEMNTVNDQDWFRQGWMQNAGFLGFWGHL